MTRRLDERFADWVDGRLGAAERAALEAEMARDPELRRAADEYRQGVQLVRSALAPEDMAESIADAVMARVQDRTPRPPRAWRPYLASLVAAAALVLVFVVLRSIPPAGEPARTDLSAGARSAGEDRGAIEELEGVGLARRAAPKAAASRESASGQKSSVREDLEDVRQPAASPSADNDAAARKGGERNFFHLGAAPQDQPRAKDGDGGEPGSTGGADGSMREQVQDSLTQGPRLQPDKEADARGRVGMLAFDESRLGDLALVVDVASPADSRVWQELDARADTTVAEILALLAPPLDSPAAVPLAIDYRRVAAARMTLTAEPKADGEAPRQDEKDAAAGAHLETKQTARLRSDFGAATAPGGQLAALALTGSDRVFRVAGTRADLSALVVTLQARVRGQLRFARLAAPVVGQSPELRVAEREMGANERVAAARPVGGPAQSGPASPGPSSRGSAQPGRGAPPAPFPTAGGGAAGGGAASDDRLAKRARAAPEPGAPETAKKEADTADRFELLLVLRPPR